LRKNLIALNADRTDAQGKSNYVHDAYIYDGYLHDKNQYQSNSGDNSLTIQYDYPDFYEPSLKYKKSSYESVPPANLSRRTSNGSQNDGKRGSHKIPD